MRFGILQTLYMLRVLSEVLTDEQKNDHTWVDVVIQWDLGGC